MSQRPHGKSILTLRGAIYVVIVALFAVGAAITVGYLTTPEEKSQPINDDAGVSRPVPATAAELALVAPLAPQGMLQEFQVQAIYAVNQDGVMQVVCVKDSAVIRLDIALLTDQGPLPPATTDRYAIFYSIRNASPEEGEQLAKALATILMANTKVPAPPNMKAFVPPPPPLPPI